jgi:DNA-binding winged helix-turn-helix (wHTH) protein
MSELQRLRDRVQQLEDIIGLNPDDVGLIAYVFHLPRKAAEVLNVLTRRRGVVTKEVLFYLVYGGLAEADQPDPEKVLPAMIMMCRNALRGHRIKISTVYKIGWIMDEEDRRKCKSILSNRIEGIGERINTLPTAPCAFDYQRA